MIAYKTFTDKVCVITGAGSGIGRALAIHLSEAGALLALSDIDTDGLQGTKNLISERKPNHFIFDQLDVSNAEQIIEYADRVQNALGPASYVFNVAGLSRVGDFASTPLASFEHVMNVNFYGVVRMSKAFLKQLKQTKGGLINISSLFGLIGFAGQAHYCASKFAVRGFSETLAQELERDGICVTSVHPGGVSTNIAKNSQVDALPDQGKTREEMISDFDKLAITSPEKAAQIILTGAAKRKRRVIVGKDAKIVSAIQRLFPQKYPIILRKILGDKGSLS